MIRVCKGLPFSAVKFICQRNTCNGVNQQACLIRILALLLCTILFITYITWTHAKNENDQESGPSGLNV